HSSLAPHFGRAPFKGSTIRSRNVRGVRPQKTWSRFFLSHVVNVQGFERPILINGSVPAQTGWAFVGWREVGVTWKSGVSGPMVVLPFCASWIPKLRGVAELSFTLAIDFTLPLVIHRVTSKYGS